MQQCNTKKLSTLLQLQEVANWHDTMIGHFTRALQDQRSFYKDVHNTMFKGYFLFTKKQTHLRRSRSSSRRTACTLSTVALLYIWSIGNTNCKRSCSLYNRSESLHPGARHSLSREVGGRSSFGVVRWVGFPPPFLSPINGRKEDCWMLHRKCRTPCEGNTSISYSIFGHELPSEHSATKKRDPVPEKELKETLLELFEALLDEKVDDDAAQGRTSLPTEMQKQHLPRLERMRAETLLPTRTNDSFAGKTKANESQPIENHNVVTPFPKDLKCEVCRMTETTRARCINRPLTRADGIPPPVTFGFFPADTTTLNFDNESSNDHRHDLIVQDGYWYWIQWSRVWRKDSPKTAACLQMCIRSSEKPRRIYADNSKEFINECQELHWMLDTKTPHRIETHNIAERAVRRVKEESANSDGSKWPFRRRDGMSLLLAESARQDGRWQDNT